MVVMPSARETMLTHQIATRVPASLFDALERFRRERGMARNEAVRALLRHGLEAERVAPEPQD